MSKEPNPIKMPTDLERAPKTATTGTNQVGGGGASAPGGAAVGDAITKSPGSEQNLIDSLRREQTAERDLIPIWVMGIVFFVLWVLVIWLMAPRWWDEYRIYSARSNVRAGNHTTAIKRYESLLKDYPKNNTYHLEIGMEYKKIGKWPEALQHFQKTQDIEDTRSDYVNDSDQKIPRGDYHDAIGEAQLTLGDLDGAEKSLTQALKVNRLNPIANFNMAVLEVKRKNFKKAMDYFKVVAVIPGYDKLVQPYYDQIEKEVFNGV